MVEIYLNNRRCPNVESQLLMNWNLKLPNNLEACNDILSELQKAINKLEESNEYIRNALKESDDAELLSAVEENELVIRRKRHQVEQLTSHIESLVRH